jgi:hypothetical protein
MLSFLFLVKVYGSKLSKSEFSVPLEKSGHSILNKTVHFLLIDGIINYLVERKRLDPAGHSRAKHPALLGKLPACELFTEE